MGTTDVRTRVDADVVECAVRVEASPETIFPFLTDPDRLCAWMGKTAKLDPRPGGGFEVHVAGTWVARGSYVEIDEPHRVVFTWGWEGEGHPVPPESSTVEITLTPDGDGTQVVLRHTGLPSEEMRVEHSKGWTHYLGRLAIAASGGDAGPDEGPAGA